MNDEWIDASKELPPCDGPYWIVAKGTKESMDGTGDGWSEYDGYGFVSGNKYVENVKWWKPYRIKKYGKM